MKKYRFAERALSATLLLLLVAGCSRQPQGYIELAQRDADMLQRELAPLVGAALEGTTATGYRLRPDGDGKRLQVFIEPSDIPEADMAAVFDRLRVSLDEGRESVTVEFSGENPFEGEFDGVSFSGEEVPGFPAAGRHESRMRWSSAEERVTSHSGAFLGQIMCELVVPLETPIPATESSYALQLAANASSETSQSLLETFNRILASRMIEFPHTITFSDQRLDKLRASIVEIGDGRSHVSFNAGEIEDTRALYSSGSIDFGGTLHSECRRKWRGEFPAIAAKVDNPPLGGAGQ